MNDEARAIIERLVELYEPPEPAADRGGIALRAAKAPEPDRLRPVRARVWIASLLLEEAAYELATAGQDSTRVSELLLLAAQAQKMVQTARQS